MVSWSSILWRVSCQTTKFVAWRICARRVFVVFDQSFWKVCEDTRGGIQIIIVIRTCFELLKCCNAQNFTRKKTSYTPLFATSQLLNRTILLRLLIFASIVMIKIHKPPKWLKSVPYCSYAASSCDLDSQAMHWMAGVFESDCDCWKKLWPTQFQNAVVRFDISCRVHADFLRGLVRGIGFSYWTYGPEQLGSGWSWRYSLKMKV